MKVQTTKTHKTPPPGRQDRECVDGKLPKEKALANEKKLPSRLTVYEGMEWKLKCFLLLSR